MRSDGELAKRNALSNQSLYLFPIDGEPFNIPDKNIIYFALFCVDMNWHKEAFTLVQFWLKKIKVAKTKSLTLAK